MDGAGFKDALARMGYTQSSFARELRLPVRTIQRWAIDGPPEHIAFLLGPLIGQFIPQPHDLVWAATDGGVVEAAGALELSLQSWLQRAVRAGWPQEVAAAGAITCFARLLAGRQLQPPTRR